MFLRMVRSACTSVAGVPRSPRRTARSTRPDGLPATRRSPPALGEWSVIQGEAAMTDVLDIETDGHLRVLRLNRPERKIALTGALIEGIVAGLRDAANDDDVWAVALTGN